ncbi:hypothetical protein FF1_045377 [Malus domestica]
MRWGKCGGLDIAIGVVVRASYVLSKGWIRFVKEKKLKVGDVVRPRNLDISGIREMHGRVGDPLRTVQDHGVVRLFGVNISRKPVHCRE